ncbi:C1 family peptidase [Carnobacterium gallinarum]|uniref:C1 family peptidase n=1 Tax=Carnobacterium gallinarum TaxID=2749 RepID=UPI00054EB469|nr:C1 family peptidase [Carnobacterium gallinarum]
MSKEITTQLVQEFNTNLAKRVDAKAIQNAIMKNGINAATENMSSVIAMTPLFSDEIETGKVANQMQSGRCWMFAALNTFRHLLSSKYNIKDFELSQNYVNFWDKFEKSNFFLESIIETSAEPLDGRLVSWLLETPQQDGGQWDMLVSLIKKYGVVPKSAMPETFQSSKSADLNHLLDSKLRSNAFTLRSMITEGKSVDQLAAVKTTMLQEIYQLLTFSLGTPPSSFDFEYRNLDNEFKRELNLTPLNFFAKYVDLDLDDYVSVIHAPTADKPLNQTYTVEFLGNVIGGTPIHYLNVEMSTLKELAIRQIQDNESVWFGCDVGKASNRVSGIMDTAIFDYQQAFGFNVELDKAQRLDYKDSILTHAMVLTGVNLVDGKSNRWKVENSWGEKAGNNGYFTMSDDWMDHYTYQVVINKKHLSPELQAAWKQAPHSLKPWDPMGSLAIMH